jgi:hypothetical protein
MPSARASYAPARTRARARARTRLLSLLLILATTTAAARPHQAARPHHPSRGSRYIVHPADGPTTPAARYGAMTPEACYAELAHRGAEFGILDSAVGVAAPIRLAAPLRGVEYRTDLKEAARATTPWEIVDCREALALDDLATILAGHGVVEVRHYSLYRPPGKRWPDGKLGIQHNAALAIDAARFRKADGTDLDVLRDFHGRIGDVTCGPDAHPRAPNAAALELRAILCEAVERRLFNVVLTPNYNRPHRNHFHMEVMAGGVTWFLVH